MYIISNNFLYLVSFMKNSDNDTNNVDEENNNHIERRIERSTIKTIIQCLLVQFIMTFLIKMISFNVTNTVDADIVVHLWFRGICNWNHRERQKSQSRINIYPKSLRDNFDERKQRVKIFVVFVKRSRKTNS